MAFSGLLQTCPYQRFNPKYITLSQKQKNVLLNKNSNYQLAIGSKLYFVFMVQVLLISYFSLMKCKTVSQKQKERVKVAAKESD